MNNSHYKELMKIGAPIIEATTSSLSVLGSCLVIGTYVMYKDIQSPSRHLIVCISISDLITSISNLYASYGVEPKNKLACILQSFVGTTAMMCSFMWTMMLAIFLFISLDREQPSLAIRLIHPWFHLLSWLLPLGVNLVAIWLSKLGNNQDAAVAGWCWIKIDSSELIRFI